MNSQRLLASRSSNVGEAKVQATSQLRPQRPANREALSSNTAAPSPLIHSWRFSQTPIFSSDQSCPANSAAPLLQAKLEVGGVDDPLEREADQLAAQVMRAPAVPTIKAQGTANQLQRKCVACEEESEKKLSRAPTSPAANAFDHKPAPAIVHHALQSPGQPLDAAPRGFMESRFGHDFSRVRIHAYGYAAQSASAIHARAYTVGNSIVFAQNQYAPHTETGQRLLAHELSHVLQQSHPAPASGRSLNRHAFAERPSNPILQRQPDKSPTATPPLTLGGHTITGDRRSVDQILQSQLKVGPDGQPLYLGVPTTLDEVIQLLKSAAPTITDAELQGRVRSVWNRKSVAGGSLLSKNPPQLNIDGHTLAGDRRAVDQLLQSQLTVGPYTQPLYLGTPMSLDSVAGLLRKIAPVLTDTELLGSVYYAWNQKLASTRQLPPLFGGPIKLPPGPTPPPPYLTPGPEPQPPSPGTPAQPSVGPQMVINISRGPGQSLVGGSMQRQYTLGDNLQVVFQDSTDVTAGTYTAVAGGQALTPSLIDSKIVQLQPFIQLLAGLSQTPGNFSASMTVQLSTGAQLTLKFGPITIQISVGFQVTETQGQPSQTAATFSATVGPTNPDATGTQNFGKWYIGVAPPPPLNLPSQTPGQTASQGGGGMLIFGGRF